MVTLDHSPVRSDPAVLGGPLVFQATRVPVQSLLDYLDDGYSLDQFLTFFPSVHREDAEQFLQLARGASAALPRRRGSRPNLAFAPSHLVTTVQELAMAGVSNGELLARLEGQFDVLITADKNLRYQQNLSGRSIAIVELPTNRLPALVNLQTQIAAVVEACRPGEYHVFP